MAPFSGIALLAVALIAVVTRHACAWLLYVYAGLSALAVVMYGLDKLAARQGAWRVPEHTLLTLALLGGWPGALVAQWLFRHKTRKRRFQAMHWLAVVINVAGLVALSIVPPECGWQIVW